MRAAVTAGSGRARILLQLMFGTAMLAAAGVVPAAVAERPLRDPFERPSAVAAPLPAALAGAALPLAPPESPWPPGLRAVVFDGPRSLINLGGHIMGIGEVMAGHRLVTVEERSATFVKDGIVSKVMLDKEQ